MVGVSLRSEKICRTGRSVLMIAPQRPQTITEQGRASARTLEVAQQQLVPCTARGCPRKTT